MKKTNIEKLQKRLGATLRRTRKVADVSQESLASLLNVHQAAVSRVETGFQKLEPWQLEKISGFFDVGVDELFSAQVNYCKIAAKFKRKPPYPAKYCKHPHTRLREVLPFLIFLREEKGKTYVAKYLKKFKLEAELLMAPDQEIGSLFYYDLLNHMISTNILTRENVKNVIEKAQTRYVTGFLHKVFTAHDDPMNLVLSLVTNHHHYSTDFKMKIEGLSMDSLELSLTPNDHMKKLPYRDEVLGDFLCFYKRNFISALPGFINKGPLEVIEQECHFKGADKCLYQIRFK